MDNPGQPLLTDTMVYHCSITMVKPCLTIVKTILTMLVQFYKNVKTMVKHGLTIVYHVIAWFYSYGLAWLSMVIHTSFRRG